MKPENQRVSDPVVVTGPKPKDSVIPDSVTIVYIWVLGRVFITGILVERKGVCRTQSFI